MSNSGQSCDAPTRMLVEKSIYERAVQEAAEAAKNIKVDMAQKKGDHIGPVVSKTQFDSAAKSIQYRHSLIGHATFKSLHCFKHFFIYQFPFL